MSCCKNRNLLKRLLKRGFEVVDPKHRKFPDKPIHPPLIGTTGSAGCDVYSNETVTVPPGEFHTFWLDIKIKIPEGEHAQLHLRSSMGLKGWRNALGVGIIDADYYGNPKNDGNVALVMQNMTNDMMTIEEGDRIGQIIFVPFSRPNYGYVDSGNNRMGGYGSTNK